MIANAWRVMVPIKVESANRFIFGNPWKYRRYANRWKHVMGLLIGQASSRAGRRGVVVIRSLRARELDTDNLAGGCKPILDWMVSAGWLADDSPGWCVATYEQEITPKAERGTWVGLAYDE